MALPASGAISFRDINVELGLSPTAQISLGSPNVRTLFGIASGAIAMGAGYGKSNRAAISYTYSASAANPSLDITTIGGYSAGTSDVTITINSGVYLYSTSTGTPGLTLSGGSSGDTVTVVNNGYIMGKGGLGVKYPDNGLAGGTALQLGFNTTVNNTNGSAYIGGGGGSGGAGGNGYIGSGGGAGGGDGGPTNATEGTVAGGSGGSIGSSGSDGGSKTITIGKSNYYQGSGGGGGRIFPGTGGAGGGASNNSNVNGKGGGAGGGGAGSGSSGQPGGAGGSGTSSGATGGNGFGGSGGGGWGATGGNGYDTSGGAGGKAVNLNGYTVTWTSGNTTRVYGSVA